MAFLLRDVRSKGAGSTGAERKLSALSEYFAFRLTADYIGGKALAV
jgi:hypothetical protein